MIDFIWKNYFKKEEKSIESILKENPLFCGLSNKELKLLNNIMHQRSFIPGEFIFQEGKGLGMYIILNGHINILHNNSSDKQPVVISQLKQGDFFGELCLAQENGHHYVSAQAFDECKLIGFFRPNLLTLNKTNPSTSVRILMNLSEILGARLQKASEKLTQFKQIK